MQLFWLHGDPKIGSNSTILVEGHWAICKQIIIKIAIIFKRDTILRNAITINATLNIVKITRWNNDGKILIIKINFKQQIYYKHTNKKLINV